MKSSELLKRLFINLQATSNVYARLLEVAERKQEHIIKSRVDSLREDLQLEEKLARDGAELNSERDELHRKCVDLLELGPDLPKLEELVAHMPQEWADRFIPLRLGIRKTLDRLHRVNRLNMSLLNNSIDLMQGLLAALFNVERNATYSRKGAQARVQDLPVCTFDTRA